MSMTKVLWDKTATLQMICFMKDRDVANIGDRKNTRIQSVINLVWSDMCAKGYTYSKDQITNKWKKLRQTYFKNKTKLNTPGSGAKALSWPFMSAMDKLYSLRPRSRAINGEAGGIDSTALDDTEVASVSNDTEAGEGTSDDFLEEDNESMVLDNPPLNNDLINVGNDDSSASEVHGSSGRSHRRRRSKDNEFGAVVDRMMDRLEKQADLDREMARADRDAFITAIQETTNQFISAFKWNT